MLWDLVGAGASYQVSVCSLQTLLNTKARLLVKLPVHTSSSRRSSCRTAAVVWARSRLEHLGKIACGHRDNNCIAWASLWRIIISFREILGSEWARFLARVFCVFQSSNPKAFFFFCQWNIIEHSGCKLFRSNVSILHAPPGPAWQRGKGWPSTAKQQTKRSVYTNLEQLICCQKQKAERTPGWKELAVFGGRGLFLSPLRSGLFNWKQLVRVLGRDVWVQPTWLRLPLAFGVPELHSLVLFSHTRECFYSSRWYLILQMRGKSDCSELLEGKRESCGSGFDYIRWQCAIFTPHSFHFFAHSVIFLCKWLKRPNFPRLYCVRMWRCNLTKCCSESWLSDLPTTAWVCVCVCTFLAYFLHNLPNLGALCSFFCIRPGVSGTDM